MYFAWNHGNPQPSCLRGYNLYNPYVEGPKTIIFPGFWGPKEVFESVLDQSSSSSTCPVQLNDRKVN